MGRWSTTGAGLLLAVLIAGCGGKTSLFSRPGVTATTRAVPVSAPAAARAAGRGAAVAPALPFPALATKNTTRIPGTSAVQDAAAVALSVYPSAAPGTHPPAVVLAPTADWPAALAAAALMAPPFRAPLLLSGPGALPAVTAAALRQLAPTGERSLGGAQVVRVGNVPAPRGLHSVQIPGNDPYSLAAAIDSYAARERGKESVNVVVTSANSPAYAMPAAGWAAESGEPVLFVSGNTVPAATAQALAAHHHPHIYVLGPPSTVSGAVVAQLSRYGSVKRVGAGDPAANAVAFAAYRDPPCAPGQPCVHVPHSFGWAIRSPGHAYVLMEDTDPLVAAAAAALSSSGGYGPELLVEDPSTLPGALLNYFLDYATPGYTQEGPTAAVYNHGWLIGDERAISLGVQAQVDSLLEVVPQK